MVSVLPLCTPRQGSLPVLRTSAQEILDLKVCDFACGFAAFLGAAARYLSARLVATGVVDPDAASSRLICAKNNAGPCSLVIRQWAQITMCSGWGLQ
jgi:hypothetical protein